VRKTVLAALRSGLTIAKHLSSKQRELVHARSWIQKRTDERRRAARLVGVLGCAMALLLEAPMGLGAVSPSLLDSASIGPALNAPAASHARPPIESAPALTGAHLPSAECATKAGIPTCADTGNDLAQRGVSVPASWTNLSPFPVNLSGYSIADDKSDGYVVLFGGLLRGEPTNDTWVFVNGTWVNMTHSEPVAPSPRYDMLMTYDSTDGYVLAYGGISTTTCTGFTTSCNDTWKFVGGHWSRLNPSCYFPGRGFAACGTFPAASLGLVADDPSDRYVLLYSCGSCTSVGTGEDWTFQNGTWTDWSYNYTTNVSYYGPRLGSIAFDPSGKYVVGFAAPSAEALYSGGGWANTTWKWSQGVWTNITGSVLGSPPPRYDPGFSSDTNGGYALLYGGWNFTCTQWAGSSCSTGSYAFLGDTWMFSNGSWSNLSTTGGPGPREALLVDDPADRGILLVGGTACRLTACGLGGGIQFVSFNDTWSWGTAPPISGLVASAARYAADVGIPIGFSASFRGGSPNVTVSWDFGDGNVTPGSNVSHAYRGPGNYTVGVWVNDSSGSTANTTLSIEVRATPGSTIVVAPSPSDVGVSTQFAPNLAGGTPPFAFAWSFGDGAYSNLSSPSHQYLAPGTFRVSLNVTDSGGSVNRSVDFLTVNPRLLVTQLNSSSSQIDLGRPINFTANASGGTPPYVYAWVFGDGGIGGNLRNITHIFTTNGPFATIVKVTDSAGQSASATLNISVTLNASIFASAALGASPLSVAFQGQAQGGVPSYLYSWEYGDGTSGTGPSLTHVYTTAGEYQVTLSVQDSDGHFAQAIWLVAVFPGGGQLALQIALSSTRLSPGESASVTAVPSGGVGAYTVSWNELPIGCSKVGILLVECTAASNGTFSVGASMHDSAGHSTNASTSFSVGGSGAPSGKGAMLFGLPLSTVEIAILIILAAVIIGLAASFTAITKRGEQTTQSNGNQSGPYVKYRRESNPPSSSSANEGDAEPDTLKDIF
jgi:PKD repeat protein